MTLDCRDITALLDDYLDRQLDAVRQQALDEHLQHCPQCCLRRDRASMLQTALHDLPAPASRPGFVNEALARAGRGADGGTRYARRPLFAMALAASLALAVGVVVLVGTQPGPAPTPTPVQIVTLTVEQPETLRLRFNSAKALPAATLSLTLPENLELAGYGARRELTWQTDLNEGGNLLQLPLVARGAVKGDLVARLSHGESSKTFRVKIEVRSPGKTGMSAEPLATSTNYSSAGMT